MIRTKYLWIVMSLVACLSVGASATAVAPWIDMYVAGSTAVWLFNNTSGADVTGLQLEFDQEVTIVNKVELGGAVTSLGPLTGTTFTLVGGLVSNGTLELDWQPANAVPTFAIWLSGERAVGKPFFTTIAKLGYLFGVGIVGVREANPEALAAGFAQFFADNEDYLAGLSATLGMSLADSLMPIIMASPAEGIENFFNTIMGMLGITSLSEVVGGDVNWGALFTMLGM